MAASRIVRGLIVGIVVTLGVVLFMGAILVVGQQTRLFAPKYTYRTNFPDASGLRVGSPVMMAGVRIGTVSDLILPTNPESEGIEVFLSVDEAYAARVREGTHASLVILQVVANEKAVALTPGDPEGRQLEDGAFIPPKVQEAILETGRSIATTVEDIATDLREVLAAIRRGEGLVGKAIVDPEFGREGLATVQSSLESLDKLLSKLNRGEGLVGRALVDDEFASAIAQDLEKGTRALGEVAQRLERGEGLLGQMTVKSEADGLLGEIHSLSESMSNVAKDLEWGRGLAGRLLKDEELADRVAANLDETLANLASITRKIDQGQGTLGLLVNDRALHDDVKLLVRGVRESRILSWLIRRYYRKGKEAVEDERGEAQEEGA
jgi:phospholipid/cholesterol/gamma-HCH transport system substrate-binding protein